MSPLVVGGRFPTGITIVTRFALPDIRHKIDSTPPPVKKTNDAAAWGSPTATCSCCQKVMLQTRNPWQVISIRHASGSSKLLEVYLDWVPGTYLARGPLRTGLESCKTQRATCNFRPPRRPLCRTTKKTVNTLSRTPQLSSPVDLSCSPPRGWCEPCRQYPPWKRYRHYGQEELLGNAFNRSAAGFRFLRTAVMEEQVLLSCVTNDKKDCSCAAFTRTSTTSRKANQTAAPSTQANGSRRSACSCWANPDLFDSRCMGHAKALRPTTLPPRFGKR